MNVFKCFRTREGYKICDTRIILYHLKCPIMKLDKETYKDYWEIMLWRDRSWIPWVHTNIIKSILRTIIWYWAFSYFMTNIQSINHWSSLDIDLANTFRWDNINNGCTEIVDSHGQQSTARCEQSMRWVFNLCEDMPNEESSSFLNSYR